MLVLWYNQLGKVFIVDFRIMVNSIITYTLSTHNQPPKSPLSGGLHEASIRGTIDERLHIYIVHYN